MTNTALDRYKRLVLELIWERIQRPVSLVEEGRYTEELEQSWFEMSEAERLQSEAWADELHRRSGPDLGPIRDVSLSDAVKRLPHG